ncbi:hypothetical protein [Xenorhabdus kozodoii]|uniref:hypothetical protein n=1 Tax=Xenorhabdus kozodoii TaxID=351676 RepID=UPI000C0471EC|nr:hypothetical protein [Xenorhabdus kozodoii]
MVKEKRLNAKGLFLLLIDNVCIVSLLRCASHLADISGVLTGADDEKQARIVDNLIAVLWHD